MTTPLLDQFDTGDVGDMFEDRDDDMLDGIAHDAGVSRPTQASTAQTAPIPGGGKLLEEPNPAKVFKQIDRGVIEQERLARNRDQSGKHWDRVRRGVPFSYLEKSEDQAVWEAKLAPGVEDVQQPIPNKVLDLSAKQVSQILVDPPIPNPKPDGDSEQARSAMDLAVRFLRADGDVSGTNDSELYREVLTLNRTQASAFVFVWVDRMGGGWRPKQKQAHPFATDPSNALMGPKLDPQTQQPMLDATGQPILERTADPVLRYIGEADGSDGDDDQGDENAAKEVFVAHASEAAREWLPKHRRMILHPNQVRTFPRTATAFQAQKITLLLWEPLSEARKRFDCLAGMSDVDLKALTTWKPKRWKSIVPEAQRPKGDGVGGDGEVTDEVLLFWYHHFCRISPDYPDGAEIAVNGASLGGSGSGKGAVLLRDTLREDVETDEGELVPVLMDPPVAQFRALLDVDWGDPFGMAPVSSYGGANEIRAHLYLSTLEDIDVKLHPNTYLTADSSVTKEDMNRRDGTPLEVLTKDHMPTFEERPDLPSHLPEMLERIEHDMDTLANLNQTAQGLDSSYSQSGIAKQTAVAQAKVQLAQDWQGFINGFLQYMKIKLQLAQAKLKTPQLVRAAGQNSAYKARHFVGADLIGVSSTSLMPGTGTMMSPAEKMQYLANAQGQKWLDPEEAADLFRSTMSDDLGLDPSPHEEHIDREIADWMEGPPAGWEQQYAAVQQFPQLTQQYQARVQQIVASLQQRGMDQQTAAAQAQQQIGPAPTQPPDPPTPFDPRANDDEPVVAKIHYAKLSRFMSTTEYSKQPASWRAHFDKRYAAAASAAGILTVAQQQQAQQAQAQAAQQADIAKINAEKSAVQSAADAPPAYQQFLAAVNNKVVSMVELLAAKEVAAIGEATDVATKPLPIPVPETIDNGAPSGPEPTHPLDLLHTSAENAKSRAHELTMATVNHANDMEQMLAKAGTQPPRPSGVPRPARPT
jgi:hypothetical protein